MMKYQKPKLRRLFPSKICIGVCMNGDMASSISCTAGPEATGGCKAGAAAGTHCLEGAAAGSLCNTGTGFDDEENHKSISK